MIDRKDPKKVQVLLIHAVHFLNVLEEMRRSTLEVIKYMKESKKIPSKMGMRALRKKTLELTGITKELRACTMHVEGLRKNSRYQPGDNANNV